MYYIYADFNSDYPYFPHVFNTLMWLRATILLSTALDLIMLSTLSNWWVLCNVPDSLAPLLSKIDRSSLSAAWDLMTCFQSLLIMGFLIGIQKTTPKPRGLDASPCFISTSLHSVLQKDFFCLALRQAPSSVTPIPLELPTWGPASHVCFPAYFLDGASLCLHAGLYFQSWGCPEAVSEDKMPGLVCPERQPKIVAWERAKPALSPCSSQH